MRDEIPLELALQMGRYVLIFLPLCMHHPM